MREKRYLIDSNIIIYHLNQDDIASNFLLQNFQDSAISRVTFIEVLSFNFTSEVQRTIIEYLERFEIIDTDKSISIQASENRKIKKIKLPDNIIVSTAQVYNLNLVTRNTKDFKVLRVDSLNPFDNNGAMWSGLKR